MFFLPCVCYAFACVCLFVPCGRLLGKIWPLKYFTDCSKAVLFVWIFYVFCLVFVMPLCSTVNLCLAVSCWEMADLLALVCGV